MPQGRKSAPRKRVEQLIFRDELTAVFNRRYLFQYLPQEIQRVRNQRGQLWLFMIDVDDFKTINDRFGHLSGDIVLKSVADILQQCVRGDDTVIRYAGDEFTVILPSGKVGDALAVSDRIMKAISEYKFASESGQSLGKINLSIGIASYPDDTEDPVRLIDLADKALYASKQGGKNRVSLVSDISATISRGREILERFPCPKLIERDSQWQQLMTAFQRVVENTHVELVTVTGQAGSGKTRLIDEFSKYIISNGKTLFIEKCTEKYITQPYWNLLDSLEKYLRSVTSSDISILKDISEVQLGILARNLPAVKEVFGIQPQGSDLSREQREEEFAQSLIVLLNNISQKNSLFILLDDFHYIDEKTLELIHSLEESKSSIMFCCVFTKAEFLSSEDSEYPLFKKEDSLISRSTTLELGNLSFEASVEMIDAILEVTPSEELPKLIYKISKGSPLFIEELLKFLIQKGFLYYQKGKWGNIEISESDVPDSLEGVIRERIKSLDKNAQEIISKAAVIGQDFNLELLHRMGKEDEGYILDILESAKRAGLIKETATPYGEELSFVSEEIRKVLYNLMAQDKTKSLHQKLGEIKEGLHADNLDEIAGELFYHFKKAEDQHRATQYAKRIKESEGRVYDRAIKYAKEILQGVEEKEAVAPLSKKNIPLISDIVRLIYILNLNIMLYPSKSEMIVKPISEILKKLSEIFVRNEIVVLGEVKGALIVNEERPKALNLKKSFEGAFLSFLKTHGIETLSLKKGLTKTEFFTFMEAINEASEDKSASDVIREKKLSHVEVNDVTYEVIDKRKKTQERARLEESMLIDYLLGKVSGAGSSKEIDLSKQLENHAQEVADAMTRIGEMAAKEGHDKQADAVAKSVRKIGSQIINKKPQEWEKHKKSLAKTIMNLEPKLRKEVLLSQVSSQSKEKRDIIKELIPEFPDEVVIDLLKDEFEEAKTSPTKMKFLIQKILTDAEQRQRILPTLKNKFIREGLPKDEAEWVFGEQRWKDLDSKEKVRRFLEMNANDYLGSAEEIKIESLISDTASQERDDNLIKVLNKWAEFLNNSAVDTRLEIAKATGKVNLAIPHFKHDVLSTFLELICKQLDKEKDPGVYSFIANLLTQQTLSYIDKKDFTLAKLIIQKINKISISGKTVEQNKILQESKAKLTEPQRLKLIVTELLKRVDENSYYNDILELIFEIGDPVVDLLIQEAMIEDKVLNYLGYFGAFLRRRAIGEILSKLMRKIGSDTVVKGLYSRLSHPKWYIVKNTIELFMYIHDQDLVKFLEPALNHRDLNIRTKLIFVLGRLGGKDSINLLIKALKDKDKIICSHALRVLSKIGDKVALDALKKYTQYPELQIETQKAIKEIEKRIAYNQTKG